MQILIKHVYLLDNKKLKSDIERLWRRYLGLIDKKDLNWEEANEARAILYFLGYIFVEIIALGSLERRIPLIRPKISLDNFFAAIDRNDKRVSDKYKNNNNFKKLKEFYLIVKSIKNKTHSDGSYLDEETFNKVYKRLKPKNYF
jgi:hypothetical protein